MLYVSRFGNPELKSGKYVTVRISVGSPKWPLGYNISGDISMIAPFGILNRYEEKEDYRRAYMKRLDGYGVDRIHNALSHFEGMGKDVVLLCYEDIRKPEEWCHRTMFAEWWLNQTGEIVDELFDPSVVKVPAESTVKAKPHIQPPVSGLSEKAQKLVREREAEMQMQQMRLF